MIYETNRPGTIRESDPAGHDTLGASAGHSDTSAGAGAADLGAEESCVCAH